MRGSGMRRGRQLAALTLAGAAATAFAVAGSAGPGTAARAAVANCPWVGSSAPISQRVSQLLGAMSTAQKVSLATGAGGSSYVGFTPAIGSLCIPALNLEDGPAGAGDGMTGVTQLPAPVDVAATWDTSAGKLYGSVIGAEQAAKGTTVDLGPTINIVRDPRWGRAFESVGEDPYLNGTMGAADIQGVQSTGTMAQVKHFAVYNQETNRNTPSDNAVVRISGTPATAGTSTVTVTARDGNGAQASASFVWTVAPAGSGLLTAVLVGYSSLCLDVAGDSNTDGTKVDVYTCNGTDGQQWTEEASGSGDTIHADGKCLDVTGGGTADGTLVQLYTCNGTGAQVWQPQAGGAIVNPQSGKCLDDTGWSTTPGTQVQIWDCTGGANQSWSQP